MKRARDGERPSGRPGPAMATIGIRRRGEPAQEVAVPTATRPAGRI
jgi:hypothetical protein